MGWASGSSLFSDIISSLLETDIDDDAREKVYMSLIPAFESFDCDTLMECMGVDKVFDKAYQQINPEYFDEEDEEEDEDH